MTANAAHNIARRMSSTANKISDAERVDAEAEADAGTEAGDGEDADVVDDAADDADDVMRESHEVNPGSAASR